MQYKLIRDLNSKVYKVGDILPADMGKRLMKRFREGLNEYPMVEEVKIIEGKILEKPIPNEPEPEPKEEVKEPIEDVKPKPAVKNKFKKRK